MKTKEIVDVDIRGTAQGIYKDSITKYDKDGKVVEVIDFPLRKNIITAGISTFVAGLIKGFYSGNNSYWAVGTGSQTQNPNLASLVNEYSRKKVTINFVDGSHNVTTTPTNTIVMSVTWAKGELSQGNTVILTEFGIFSDDTANLPRSGLMCDYVAHSPLSIDDTISLTRSIYFAF